MTVFAIGPSEHDAIDAAIKRARANPVPWETLKAAALADPGPYFKLADRKPGRPRPKSEQVDLPFGWRLAISFEHQPSGLCQHISISAPDPHRVPNEHAVAMVAEACGMQWPPGERSRVWLEDFIAGSMVGKAVNLVEVVELAT